MNTDNNVLSDVEIINEGFSFIGPPGSGKSVFFVAMLNFLNHETEIIKDGMQVEMLGDKTEQYVNDVMDGLQSGKWPPQTTTGKNKIYGFNVLTPREWFNPLRIFNRYRESRTAIRFHDWPGEAYEGAFIDRKEHELSEQYLHEGEKLKTEIKQSTGLFLLIDSTELFNHKETKQLRILFKLAEFLEENQPLIYHRKIAVVFTKYDMVREQNFDPEKRFRDFYVGSWKRLTRLGAKFFKVSPFEKIEVTSKGLIIPPKHYDRRRNINLLEPLCWLLGIENKWKK